MVTIFNIGVGLIHSALYVFFRDVQNLWTIFLQLLMYMSAIFYRVTKYPPEVQKLFNINPVYLFISYFRQITIDGVIPPLWLHLLILFDVIVFVAIGCRMYKKYNTEFLYYL